MKRLRELSLLPRGKVYETPIYGGPVQRLVYQRCRPENANAGQVGQKGLMLRKYVIPADPRTAAQLDRREQFANAVNAWQQLPQIERAAWQRAARNKQMSGYNHFLSSWLRGMHRASTWDSGASSWDSGASSWDE